MLFFTYFRLLLMKMSESDSDTFQNSSSSDSSDSEEECEVEENVPASPITPPKPADTTSSSSSSEEEKDSDDSNDDIEVVGEAEQSQVSTSKSRDRSRSPFGERRDLVEAVDIGLETVVVGEDNQKGRDRAVRGKRVDKDHDTVAGNKTEEFVWVGPKRGAKSQIWKHCGFKKLPDKAVNYEKVFCKLCDYSFNYKGSCTNLKVHLNNKHSFALEEADNKQPLASDYFEDKNPRKIKYPKGHPINKKTRSVMVKWFCKRDRPFKMSEDPEFAEFCDILDSKYELPSRMTVTREMEATYKSEKEKLVNKLKNVEFLHGTNDGGSAINGESFLSNTVHYVDPTTWKLESVTLGCIVMKEAHTAVNYRAHIDATEDLFEIKGKVLGYTTDNENKMHSSFRNDVRNGCIAHIQSKTMAKAVDSVKSLKKLRKKLRKLAKLGKFSKFKNALEKAQMEKGLPNRKVLQEVKTRFTSTLTMFHSVMSFDLKKSSEENLKKAKDNMDAINAALTQVKTKKSKKLILSPVDKEMIVATAKVLKPICDMLTMLGGDKYVTGSIVLPYMKKIVYLSRVEDTDPNFIVELKRFIIRDFLRRCKENINFDLLKKATFLDPRYKSLKSIEPAQRDELMKEIKLELEGVKVGSTKTVESDGRTKKVNIMCLESSDDEDDNDGMTIEKELESYFNEPKLKEDMNPLTDFWKNKESCYPRLAVLAKKYLCVQATSTPSERVFSKMNNVVSKKRSKLTSSHTNETIFLSNVL